MERLHQKSGSETTFLTRSFKQLDGDEWCQPQNQAKVYGSKRSSYSPRWWLDFTKK
jgi:hypothetical protein